MIFNPLDVPNLSKQINQLFHFTPTSSRYMHNGAVTLSFAAAAVNCWRCLCMYNAILEGIVVSFLSVFRQKLFSSSDCYLEKKKSSSRIFVCSALLQGKETIYLFLHLQLGEPRIWTSWKCVFQISAVQIRIVSNFSRKSNNNIYTEFSSIIGSNTFTLGFNTCSYK